MTRTSSWTGNPLPNAYTLITSGYYSDLQAATVPVGFIDLDRVGLNDVSLLMYGGQFSTGTQVYSEGVGGATTLSFNAVSNQSSWFYNYGAVDDRFGELDMNVMNGEHFYNYGLVGVDSSTMSNQVISLTLSGSAYGFNSSGPTLFDNFGLLSVNGSNPGGLTGTLNINATANTEFLNQGGTVSASGIHGSVNFFGDGQKVNNGTIHVSNGAQVSFQGSGLTGVGSVIADSGSRIQVGTSVAPNETFNLTGGSTLEFWVQPKMSFLGTITGMDASDTILLDQTYATHDAFRILTTAGAGLSELTLFDQGNNVVGDFKIAGHTNILDYSLTPHATPSGNWTALTFQNVPNSAFLPHS